MLDCNSEWLAFIIMSISHQAVDDRPVVGPQVFPGTAVGSVSSVWYLRLTRQADYHLLLPFQLPRVEKKKI